MIRILLADDQTLVRDGLKALLEMQLDCKVIAVSNGEEALRAAREERPDIAVLDVRMPVMDGVECTHRLKEEHPGLPVLALTTFDDHSLVQRCLEAGANAYLLKEIRPDDLANAVQLLIRGETLIPGDLARELVREAPGRSAAGGAVFAGAKGASSSGRVGDGPEPVAPRGETGPGGGMEEPLTPRQREVLELIAAGLSNREIAGRLFLTEGTVKNIVSEIYARLNVRDRVQAVLKALGNRE